MCGWVNHELVLSVHIGRWADGVAAAAIGYATTHTLQTLVTAIEAT